MGSNDQAQEIVRTVEKVIGHFRYGIFSSREAVNVIAGELAYYRRGDLAETVLPLLTPELVSELRSWVGDVMQPGYQYQFRGVGVAPPEDDRFRTQAELVSLASRFGRLGIAPDL